MGFLFNAQVFRSKRAPSNGWNNVIKHWISVSTEEIELNTEHTAKLMNNVR